MPRRFLPGVDLPKAFPLGVIGPGDMDLHHMPFVTKTLDAVTWRLNNVAVLAHGLRSRLSYSMIGGIEEIAKYYAAKHWYDVRVFRDFKTIRSNGTFVQYDPKFFNEASGFVVFDDGSTDVSVHKRMAFDTGKRAQRFKLLEKW